jgi:uncharacterized protein (DUF2267 family)
VPVRKIPMPRQTRAVCRIGMAGSRHSLSRRIAMSGSISLFSHAAQQAQQWVNELADDLDWNERRAHHLLRTVLHAVRDWLSLEEMTDFAAQLPVLLRGIYFEGWKPAETPVWERKKDDFIERIQHAFSDDLLNDPEAAVTAVFRLFDRHISHGEIVQVRNSMKKSLRELWPAD